MRRLRASKWGGIPAYAGIFQGEGISIMGAGR